MSFQDTNQRISLKLEIDFNEGGGWEDYTKYLDSISIIQDTFSDSIIGLFTTEIEVRLTGLTPEAKWSKTNIKGRGFITVNNIEKPLFNGLTTGANSITFEEQVLNFINEPEKNLHREFGRDATGSDATDLVEYIYSDANIILDRIDMEPDGSFLPTGVYLDAFGNPSSLTNTNWREGSGLQTLDQSIRCNALINKNISNEPGIYTVDQMLKAIGLLGGYGADGSGFEVKQGYYYTGLSYPRPTFDLRNVQIFDSFKAIDNDTEYTFNTFDFSGKQFKYRRRGKNPMIEDIKGVKVSPTTNTEIDGLDNESAFLEIEDRILCDLKKGFTETKSTIDGNDGSPAQNVQLTRRANDVVNDFQGTEVASFHSTPYLNFFNYKNYRKSGDPIEFAISFRIRPVDDGRSVHTPFNTINTTASNDTAVYVDLQRFNRSVRFRYRRADGSQIAYSSNSNAFDWDEWQTITVVVGSFDNGNRVAFWKNDSFISDTAITTSIFTSVFLAVSGPQIRGRMASIKVYDLNPTSLIPQTFDLDVTRDQATNRDDSSNPYPGIVCYFPMDNSGWNFRDRINYEVFSIIATISTTSLLDEKFRAKNDSRLNILSSYSGNNFYQTLSYKPYNLDGGEAVIEDFLLYPQSSYTKIKDFTITKTNASSSETKVTKQSQSFYLNSENDANNIAEAILGVFDNGLGVYQFEVFTQPDLDVGNIITFNILEGGQLQSSVGVVLKKKTVITKFKLVDILTVKKIRNSS